MLAKVMNVFLVICGGIVYFWVGAEWSKLEWFRGGSKFDQGWLLIAVLVSQAISSTVSEGPERRRISVWIRTLPAAVPGFALIAISDHLYSALAREPQTQRLRLYATLETSFLLYILIWAMWFPYEKGFGPEPHEDRRRWRRIVCVLGVLVALITVAGTFHALGLALSVIECKRALISWLHNASLVIYFFLGVRMMYPVLERRIFESG